MCSCDKRRELPQGRYRIEIRNEICDPPEAGWLQKCAKAPDSSRLRDGTRLAQPVESERHGRFQCAVARRQHGHKRRPEISVSASLCRHAHEA
jgi:hypothetical protein